MLAKIFLENDLATIVQHDYVLKQVKKSLNRQMNDPTKIDF